MSADHDTLEDELAALLKRGDALDKKMREAAERAALEKAAA